MVRRSLVAAATLALAATVFFVGPGAQADPPPTCATPVLSAPEFAAGDSNTVTWTQPSGTLEGGGFQIDVATSDVVDGSGRLVDRIVALSNGNVGAGVRSYTFTPLDEAEHWYGIRAKSNGSVCNVGAWSDIVSTTQDATGPVVTITSPEDGDLVVGQGGLTVTGTITDTGSGPNDVTVTLTNVTPIVGALLGAPDPQTVTPDAEGDFTVTFDSLLAGGYSITATGTDNVGNTSSDEVNATVVNLP